MTTEKAVECPCGVGGHLFFCGSTTRANDRGSITQYAWCHLDHYFYVVLKATFTAHGGTATIDVTLKDPGYGPQPPVKG